MADQINSEDLRKAIIRIAKRIQENKEYLCKLDSAIGDGDHGNSMAKGFNAVENELKKDRPDRIDELFKLVGRTLMKNIGGATGPIFATLFLSAGKETENKKKANLEDLKIMFEASLEGISKRGGAEPGDKTMIDALKPAIEGLRESVKKELSIEKAIEISHKKAKEGAEETRKMEPSRGKAKSLGERALGHQDPGATSVSLMFEALDEYIREEIT